MRTKSDDDRFKRYLFMVLWLIIGTPMLWMANPGAGIASLLLWLVAVYPVYKSIRQPTQDPAPGLSTSPSPPAPSRHIPQDVKVAVSVRDGGRCRWCGSTQDLHFDHIHPWSKGGSSTDPNNIQLLCKSCNQKKRNHVVRAVRVQREDGTWEEL